MDLDVNVSLLLPKCFLFLSSRPVGWALRYRNLAHILSFKGVITTALRSSSGSGALAVEGIRKAVIKTWPWQQICCVQASHAVRCKQSNNFCVLDVSATERPRCSNAQEGSSGATRRRAGHPTAVASPRNHSSLFRHANLGQAPPRMCRLLCPPCRHLGTFAHSQTHAAIATKLFCFSSNAENR